MMMNRESWSRESEIRNCESELGFSRGGWGGGERASEGGRGWGRWGGDGGVETVESGLEIRDSRLRTYGTG